MNWLKENEINRCLLCANAPCSSACPKQVDPARRIRSLYFGNPYGAVKGFDADACKDCQKECEKACVLAPLQQEIHILSLMEEVADIQNNAEETNAEYVADLRCDICGVELENPFLLSSSVVASNYEMCAKAFEMGWAGVAFKTITLFEQHDISPRFSVLKSRTGSFYGFKNIEQLSDHALEENLEIFRRLKEKYPSKVIISSIMGRNEDEWEYLARKSDEAGADVIELNFSCPHVEDGKLGITIGQDEGLIERFTLAARRGTDKPILAKMTPNVDDMVPYARAAKRGKADGLAAINTIKSITGLNLDTLAPEPSVRGSSALGGYSGKAVKPIALRFISDMAKDEELKGMHLSAMGGIEDWRDAAEYILLGSGSLQITTAVMQYGYRIVEDLISGLKGYMEERNITNLKQLLGGALENMVEYDDVDKETILYPVFHEEHCVGCGRCYVSCYDGGHQAIAFDEETRKPTLIGTKCVGCHLCRLVCPSSSIGIAKRRVPKRK
ncbi:MAG: NAD-dependent dihydropyrimidine dehydrogenase subunit PreA [Solobacterium sp.]|nr:NAD-dependent dihydropyrimidine dehydrogenase subunit PreA [Solobacterium sp.]